MNNKEDGMVSSKEGHIEISVGKNDPLKGKIKKSNGFTRAEGNPISTEGPNFN